MTYQVRLYRKGEPSEVIYEGPRRGYAWKLFFQWKRNGLDPEDKVRIKEWKIRKVPYWKTLKTFTQYYS